MAQAYPLRQFDRTVGMAYDLPMIFLSQLEVLKECHGSWGEPSNGQRCGLLRSVDVLRLARTAVLSFALLGLLTPVPGVAQRPNLQHYSALDGLPQNQALALLQDRVGYLWVGNYGGVSRYDGESFISLTSQDGLPSNIVTHLAETSDGRIVIGTRGGVCFLKRRAAASDITAAKELDHSSTDATALGHLDCSPLPSLSSAQQAREQGTDEGASTEGASTEGASAAALPPGKILALATDEVGGTWIGAEHGLFYRGADQQSFRRYGTDDGLPSERCQALAIHRQEVWIGTDRGLVERRGDHFEPSFELADQDIRNLESTFFGLLIATSRDVFALTSRSLDKAPLPRAFADANIHDLTADSAGNAWIAGAAGLVRWSGSQVELFDQRRGLLGKVIHSVMIDHEGTLWMATDFGLTKLVPGPFLAFSEAEGLPNPMVRAITESDGELWLGTRNGAARWTGERFQSLGLDSLADPRVYAMAPASDGNLWLGTRSGLVHVREGQLEHVFTVDDGLPSSYVTALHLDTHGDLWVATDRGLVRWRDGTATPLDHPALQGSLYAYDFAVDDAHRLWIALQTGGVRIVDFEAADARGLVISKVHSLGAAEGLTDLTIWSMSPDGRTMWLGSNGDGAFRVESRGDAFDIQQLTMREGLVNNFVWQVLADHRSDVWIFTSNGLDHYDGRDLRHYDASDGLPELEGMATAALQDSAGRLWFGTSHGVVRYDPLSEVTNREPPAVIIEEVVTNDGKSIASGTAISAANASLQVHFSVLSFREEASVRLRYRLRGSASTEWSRPFSERRLTLAGLSPGNYELIAQATNEAGIWSTRPATFSFRIEKSSWREWLAALLAAIALTLVVWLFMRLRTRKLENERRRLEALVAERARALEDKTTVLEREIDERIQAENERQSLEERLRQSEKMEAVGRLAGGVAHDFNNLLTTISGFGDLVADQLGASHPLRPEVDEILFAAERAARLTQQLLAFSRKQVLEPRLLELNPVVRDITRMLGRLIGEDIELVTELDASPDTLRSDRGHLEQILVNLVINARDAMPDGGRLLLRTSNETLLRPRPSHAGHDIERGSYVLLQVEDNGTGIKEEDLEHIFEPFFTTKDTGKGTGLGLATVYGVVRQNEGYIDVESLAQGTRFIVRLPQIDDRPSDVQASGPFSALKNPGTTVLVVEDEETVRRLMSDVLEKYGYHVLTAAGGREAFAISEHYEGDIDLLLTDVIMPETDGKIVVEKLSETRPNMAVLFVSGYPDDFLGQRGVLPQGTNFLNKPFTPKRLIGKIREVLGQGSKD